MIKNKELFNLVILLHLSCQLKFSDFIHMFFKITFTSFFRLHLQARPPQFQFTMGIIDKGGDFSIYFDY